MDSQSVSCSATEAVTTFTVPFRSFIIYNQGVNAVYVDDATSVSTSNFKIPSGAFFGADLAATQLYFICDTDETATVYVMVLW